MILMINFDYIVEDIKFNPGHVIRSWSTSPKFAASGLENYCQPRKYLNIWNLIQESISMHKTRKYGLESI